MKPVQDRSECDEAEKGSAELLVARADPTKALDAGEEVFDDVAVGVRQLGIVILNPVGEAERNTRSSSAAKQIFPEGPCIKTAVSNDPAVGESFEDRIDCTKIMGRLPATKAKPTARPKPSTTAASLVLDPPLVFPIA